MGKYLAKNKKIKHLIIIFITSIFTYLYQALKLFFTVHFCRVGPERLACLDQPAAAAKQQQIVEMTSARGALGLTIEINLQ